jgi:NAD(P)-dependent dehydrogenase (short-subunit alcohol dehydrogenase family)
MTGRLDGKVAVVLGASSEGGTGWRTAEVLAEEGAHVYVAARRLAGVQDLAERIGGTAVRCDAGDPEEVEALAKAAASRTGRIDVGVLAAGQPTTTTIEDTDEQMLLEATRTNYFGAFHFIRFLARHMGEDSSMTLIGSLSSTHIFPGTVAYAAAKGALNTLVRFAAYEYAPRGIRINALLTGFIDTPMGAPLKANPEVFATIMKEVPLGRGVDPRELGRTVLWLATDARSVTGTGIYIDGGNHLRRCAFAEDMPPGAIDGLAATPSPVS